MLDYDSEEYFTHGTATVNAIEKIVAPRGLVWSDWIKGAQGFVMPSDDGPILFHVEQIAEIVEEEAYLNPDNFNTLEPEEFYALTLWLNDRGIDLEALLEEV